MRKTVLVTGADRGLGLAFCREFLSRGFLVFAGRYLQEWSELEELKKEWPETLVIIGLDVSDQKSVQQAANEFQSYGVGLDVLVSNAGLFNNHEGTLQTGINTQVTMKSFEVNSTGPLRVTQAFLPYMTSGDQRLCFVSSEAGSISNASRSFFSGYCMSKSALNMGVRLLFNELNPLGFKFRLYHPGYVQSYMLGEFNQEASISATESAKAAVEQFLEDRGEQEEVLLLEDNQGSVWGF